MNLLYFNLYLITNMFKLFHYKNIIFLYIFYIFLYIFLIVYPMKLYIFSFYKHMKKYTMEYQCIKITIDIVSIKSKGKKCVHPAKSSS